METAEFNWKQIFKLGVGSAQLNDFVKYGANYITTTGCTLLTRYLTLAKNNAE
jgi:hypothetical protein